MKQNTVKLTLEEELMLKGIDISGGSAFKNALRKGVSVTVVEGKTIYRVQPDGKRTILAILPTEKRKADAILKFKVK